MEQSALPYKDMLRAATGIVGKNAKAGLLWWLNELGGMIPETIIRFFVPDEKPVQIKLSDDGSWIEIRADTLSETQKIDAGAYDVLNSQLQPGQKAVLLVPVSFVLQQTIELPEAAIADIQSAVSFQVERVSPFRLEQVHYVARLIRRETKNKAIIVQLSILARSRIQDVLDAITKNNVNIAAIYIDDDPSVPKLNLISNDNAFAGKGIWRFNLVNLVVTAGVLFLLAAIVFSAYRLHYTAESSEENAVQVANIIKRNTLLQTQIAGLAKVDDFIARRRGGLYSVEVLNNITKRMPDGSWLFSLDIRPKEVILSGFSNDVSRLIETLSSAPFSNPELISPVVYGRAGGETRFEVRIQIKDTAS